jgi:VanZ family protein
MGRVAEDGRPSAARTIAQLDALCFTLDVPRSLIDRAALVALPVYWVVLAFATHYPTVRIPTTISYRDKVVHFTAFALLAVLFWLFARARRSLGPRFVAVAATILLVYAALDEYLQQFVGRHTDPMDYVANASGILVALAVLELRRRGLAT